MSHKEALRPGILRAAEQGKLTNAEGARALRMSTRQFRRLRASFRSRGVAGLVHGNRGRRSPRRLSEAERSRVVELINGRYAGFNDCHLTEKLRQVEGLSVSRELVRRIREEAGLPAKRTRRAPKHRRRRERAAREGALVLIDGSSHDWLEGRGPRFALVGAMDDATGKILALVVRPTEDLHGYFALLGQVLQGHGVPGSFYGDRFGALVRTDTHWTIEEQLAGRQDPTAFGRLLEELGVGFIAARSPQAKGRIERLWGTLQDRLIAEFRLRGLTTLAEVEAHLPLLIAEFNTRFARSPRDTTRAWRTAPRNLERVLTCRYTRQVARDNTVSIPGRWIQLPPRQDNRSWYGCRVEVREGLDGTAFVLYRDQLVVLQPAPTSPFTLVYRAGGNARRRCPENFTPVPPTRPAVAKRKVARRRGQMTNLRKQAATHPWRTSFKRPEPASA